MWEHTVNIKQSNGYELGKKQELKDLKMRWWHQEVSGEGEFR